MRVSCRKMISLSLVLVFLFNIVACSTKDKKASETTLAYQITSVGDPDNPYASDSLTPISINDIDVNEISVVAIDPNDIVVNSIEIAEIQSVEMQIIPLNDQIVTLAYENFRSVYGDDINIRQLLTNVAIGATCVIVYVTLTFVTGGTGAFFGAVLISEFTKAAIIIGAAIDAAVSGYQAYQEGGDLPYILGHMLNGVAEGFMWSAILAPVFGAFQGIKAVRAVNALRKIPGLSELTDREALKVLQNIANLLKTTKDLADNASDDAIRLVYEALSDAIKSEISEDVFIAMFRNRTTLTNLARTVNPLGIGGDVLDALRENFWSDLDNVADDVIDDVLRSIQNGSCTSLDDIASDEIREFIRNNSVDFINCYADKFSTEFTENWIKELIGEEAFDVILNNIASGDDFLQIARGLGHETLSAILDDPEQYCLLVVRFGQENVNRLRASDSLYRILRRNTSLGDDVIYDTIDNLFGDGISSLSSISNTTIQTSLSRQSEAVSMLLKEVGLDGKNQGLLADLAVNSISGIDGISEDVARNIITEGMGKTEIISTYGDDVWNIISNPENSFSSIIGFNIASDTNPRLISDIASDSLRSMGISDEVIEYIIAGDRYDVWGLTDQEIVDIGNIVSEYYRAADIDLYHNFVSDLAEARGRNIEDAIEIYSQNNTIINVQYAGGTMVPSGDNVDYIIERYGPIQMSSQGFPIFDDYATARVVINDLTGDEADDIARANLLHHGTQQSIPGYTWHHLEDGRTMILIPTELHEAYRHTGGAALLREGLI